MHPAEVPRDLSGRHCGNVLRRLAVCCNGLRVVFIHGHSCFEVLASSRQAMCCKANVSGGVVLPSRHRRRVEKDAALAAAV
jgi:hypothetical protein